jgi:hypothetical protein
MDTNIDPAEHGFAPPHLGQRVIYNSHVGDGVQSPADVLRTTSTTIPGVIEKWGDPRSTVSGTPRPADLEDVLPSDYHVDLLVHGLGGDYHRYSVPCVVHQEFGSWQFVSED